jgi:TrpR-related protein YerC/YecD
MRNNYIKLCRVFAGLSTDECRKFLDDLLTPQELNRISKRLEAAIKLKAGITQRKVAKELGLSSTTVSRVNRYLITGSHGYSIALATLKRIKWQL